ncbi:Abcd3 [Symbiodinium pilosum]|uniref:Abcd3 protein n=1 Tax=Symbiodinium pilosum TaxID=2952 RepID=A0A812XLA3_SYMPI|nr:Abcd3 [Symbiodinium pilosum]
MPRMMSRPVPQVVMVRHPRRSGVLGLGAGLLFLSFVSKFSERVQIYKAKNLKIKNTKQQRVEGLTDLMRFILGSTCSLREFLTVAKLSLMLLLRTVGSVWVSKHWGSIVNSVVSQDFVRLARLVSEFAGATVFLSFLNALLKYYISALRLQVREKITQWCHEKYMRPKEMIFYKANKVGQKIDNCDHQITSDVERFSDVFAEVFSQSLKPIVDFLVYSVELSRVQGLTTPLTLYSWFALASCVSAVTLPPFGELAAGEQRLEGNFRGKHSELITNCEQIAFLGGERPEKDVLNASFAELMSHCKRTINLSFNSEVLRQYLNKYFCTVIGLILIARPLRLRSPSLPPFSSDQIAQYFTSTWRNMEAMATAIQDLFELTNRIGRLSGFATRVRQLMLGLQVRPPVLSAEIEAAKQGPNPPVFRQGPHLKFENVSVYRPDGTLLVKDLNFTVNPGQRVLVTGGNGCGKSSLFRVIRKLWPLVEGTITMPDDKEIYFLTQVNFVPCGSLRDLVIYPQSRDEMLAAGYSDDDVRTCLRWAHVSPTVIHDGRAQLEFNDGGHIVRPSLDDVRDWQKDLSPGQKQRLAFARLFYHRPSFVVLDECTNGISPDVEHDLYDRCTRLNLAVFSISHKIELKLFHERELHYHGDLKGSWVMNECSHTRDKITRASSTVKLPEPDKTGKKESRITYERHVWFAE